MPRRKVDFIPGCHYHLYNRGNNHNNIFLERENYRYFLQQFRYYLLEDTLDVLAYCPMPNHYHFLVCLQAENLSQQMHAFTLSYTKAMNRRYDRCGSLFQGRFQAIQVNSERYLIHLSRYIHLNPVKAGFVQHPEEWEFSRYLEYANLRQGTLPKPEYIRQTVGSVSAYRAFVEEEHAPQLHLQQLRLD